jgi:hypothetical protein
MGAIGSIFYQTNESAWQLRILRSGMARGALFVMAAERRNIYSPPRNKNISSLHRSEMSLCHP